MSLAQVLTTYLSLNLMVLVAWGGLAAFAFILKQFNLRLSSRAELKIHYGAVFAILSLALVQTFLQPLIQPLIPQKDFFQPPIKVWSASSLQTFGQQIAAEKNEGYLSFPLLADARALPVEQVADVWLAIAFVILFLGGAFLLRDIRSLAGIRKRAFLVRKIGCVQILVSDFVRVPFSYWLPNQANVVIPSSLLSSPQNFKIALAHELQHHRHGDTRWLYILWGMRWVCALNPAIYFWNRWIMEIQEFACDETLVDQRKVESQVYACCLIEVAQSAIEQKRVPVCATGLTFLNERQLLKRRIERMVSKSLIDVNKKVCGLLGLCMAVLICGAAYASKGIVQDRRINMAQAQVMAARAQLDADMPIVVNDLVLRQLNRYIGTPEGREFMRNALARMENHKAMVAEHLEKYRVPLEVMALPIIESGYQNLAQGEGSPTNKSAGLWQFIPQTARNYGLRVDKQKDERLNAALLTDAAMRYLQANNLRFKDWHLSLMSYNMGENAVQKAMVDLDTRDAWTLIRNGREGDKDYLAKFMAAVLIMRNPASVQ